MIVDVLLAGYVTGVDIAGDIGHLGIVGEPLLLYGVDECAGANPWRAGRPESKAGVFNKAPGVGFAAAVLLSLFGFECLKLEGISARILKSNFSAVRMNKQLGYILSSEGSEFDEYLLSKKIFNSKKNRLIDLASRVV